MRASSETFGKLLVKLLGVLVALLGCNCLMLHLESFRIQHVDDILQSTNVASHTNVPFPLARRQIDCCNRNDRSSVFLGIELALLATNEMLWEWYQDKQRMQTLS